MNLKETIKILEEHNRWRRDNNVPAKIKMADPKVLGMALDRAIEELNKLLIPNVSGSLCARGITSKMKEAEEYVKYYIKVHNKPPTYKLVALNLGIGRTAAFARLRHCRELMSGRQ